MNKTIVVFDTNIFISAVFWEGKPYSVVKKAINQEIVVFISNYIIDEIRKVLTRDFNLEKQEIDDIVNAVLYFTHLIEPKESVKVINDDPKDDKILDCAVACNADFIVSQDNHLLNLKTFRGIKIASPKEFLKTLD
ncbi:putative toxin-antitoxin system toxin component, PIN family [Candidatus Woesearchaeota archaeon]|nr:putative toxin-antitoxin system toxin component, PIN family [Candidatus Woesearchaeota archaeon]